MKHKLLLWVFCLDLFLAAAWSPAPADATPEEPTPASAILKVAVVVPLTGPVATLGRAARDGALLAVEQQNAAGGLLGKSIQPIVEDSQCSAGTAINAARKVIETDGVRFIIGDVCSSSTIPMSEVTNAAGVVLVSPTATNPGVTLDSRGKAKPYVFRAAFIDPYQGTAAALFALERLRARTAFVMHDPSDPYCAGLAGTFRDEFARWGRVVGEATYSHSTDFAPILAQIAGLEPDVVYLPDFVDVANPVLGQARARGLTLPFIGVDAWETPELDVARASVSYFTAQFSTEDPRPEVGVFARAFRARFGYASDSAAALAYDAAGLVFQAIAAAGSTDPALVKNRLAAGAFHGVTGSMYYDAFHDPVKAVTIVQVKQGVGISFYGRVGPAWPRLLINHFVGRAGSSFTLSGAGFPPLGAATVKVNGATLSESLAVDELGGLSVLLDTAGADNGRYVVTVSVNPSAQAVFVLDDAEPLLPPEGEGPVLALPAGIGHAHVVHLPAALQ